MARLSNTQIAAAFDELGDLYELDGAIVHRVVAYRNAAKAVREAPVSVASLAQAGRATELPGIGRTLEEKVLALIDTGDIPAARKLRDRFPPGLIAITRLPGLGPKRARQLYDEMGIDSLEALRSAVEHQRLRRLRGFGPKAEANILAALEAGAGERAPARFTLDRGLAVAEPLVAALRDHPAADRVELAGSARRMVDSVRDLDVIATANEPVALAQALAGLDLVESTQSAGEAGARVMTHAGLRVDLRIAAPDQFGSLLQHFTGSKQHNEALRRAAVRHGLHVSEYGILDDATGRTHRCATEEDVYARLGLRYIEPELRENRGELEAAATGRLPRLIRESDLRGDLHSHTVASDGRNTVEQMAVAARERGYQYLAVTDHSATMGFGNDVSPSQLERQIERVREVNRTVEGIELLAGTEVNVLPDGGLDYDDALLAELDWVIASVHSSFRISQAAMTERLLSAVEHPSVDAIGHLTGRMIGRRPGYPVDVERVIEAAVRTDTMLEINANPNRRDMSDTHARAAARAGAMIVINSDAHGVESFRVARYGIATARRAWLAAEDVANTRPWRDFARLRKRARG